MDQKNLYHSDEAEKKPDVRSRYFSLVDTQLSKKELTFHRPTHPPKDLMNTSSIQSKDSSVSMDWTNILQNK